MYKFQLKTSILASDQKNFDKETKNIHDLQDDELIPEEYNKFVNLYESK